MVKVRFKMIRKDAEKIHKLFFNNTNTYKSQAHVMRRAIRFYYDLMINKTK